jgi:2-isopropylmalate synthase
VYKRQASVRINTPHNEVEEAATGDGPIDACYKAIDRITKLDMKLLDYKLAALSGGKKAMGKVDVVVDYKKQTYHGSGASTDIVEASALAYLNAVNKIFGLKKSKRKQ